MRIQSLLTASPRKPDETSTYRQCTTLTETGLQRPDKSVHRLYVEKSRRPTEAEFCHSISHTAAILMHDTNQHINAINATFS